MAREWIGYGRNAMVIAENTQGKHIMRALRFCALAISLSIAFVAMAGSASAAESYDGCTGFIDAVPAVITTQGTWCLRQDIGTTASNIHGIDIQNHNVTIDCNHFKLGN